MRAVTVQSINLSTRRMALAAEVEEVAQTTLTYPRAVPEEMAARTAEVVVEEEAEKSRLLAAPARVARDLSSLPTRL
jgi:hypothetical protein